MNEITITIKNNDKAYIELARDLKKSSKEKQAEILYNHCCFEFRIKYGVDYDVRKKNPKYMNMWGVYDLMFEDVLKEVLMNIKQYI